MEFETRVGKSRFKNRKKLLKHIKTSLGFLLDINPEITFGLVPITQTAIYIKHILKMNKEVRMLLPKKELYNTSGVGKIKNYCEDIYIPPYNNTH